MSVQAVKQDAEALEEAAPREVISEAEIKKILCANATHNVGEGHETVLFADDIEKASRAIRERLQK